MKKIDIGGTEYEQAETAEDLSISKYTDFKRFMIYKQTGVNTPDLINTIQGFVAAYDKESKSQMLITLHDYFSGLKQVDEGFDADQMLFALITLDEDENVNKFDETLAKEKLERWNNNGLTQKIVEESVTNFMKASSTRYASFLQQTLTMPNLEE